MTSTDETVDPKQRLLARETHLRRALEFALDHSDGRAATGALIGALATLVEDADDASALEMVQDAISALVNRSARERAAAHSWHALRDGCDPNQDAIAIVDLAKLVARAAHMYRLTGTQFPTGAAAVETFRADAVALLGARVPGTPELEQWLAKVGKPKSSGGLTITGVVARIIRGGRLLGAHKDDLRKSVRRVDKVLRRLANPVKLVPKSLVPPAVSSD